MKFIVDIDLSRIVVIIIGETIIGLVNIKFADSVIAVISDLYALVFACDA